MCRPSTCPTRKRPVPSPFIQPIFLPPPQVPFFASSVGAAPLAAAIADSVVALILAPVDVWKVSAQLGTKPVLFAVSTAATKPRPVAPPVLRSHPSAPAASRTQVTSPPPLAQSPSSPWSPRRRDPPVRPAPPHMRAALLAGSGASVTAAVLLAPLELVRDRLRSGVYRTAGAALRAAVPRAREWRGMFVGMVPSICRDLPFETMEFAVFEGLQRMARAGKIPGVQPVLRPKDQLMLGMLTGAAVGAAVAPMDLIVTRVAVNPRMYPAVVESVRKIAREEGLRAFFAGTTLKVLRDAVASGIFFGCYESALDKLGLSSSEDIP